MTDILQTGAGWLIGQMKSYVGHQITYVRGAASVVLSASFGRTELEIDATIGPLQLEHVDRDFIVAAADLVLCGSQTEPQAGDQIQETVNGTTHTYEVMSPDGTSQPFRYDPGRVILRIHTKLVSVT